MQNDVRRFLFLTEGCKYRIRGNFAGRQKVGTSEPHLCCDCNKNKVVVFIAR
jgi:hypothetical protein